MIGVPKVSLQLKRNVEIRKCLELLTVECDIPVAVLTVLGERLTYTRDSSGLPADISDVFHGFLSRTSAELYMLYHIQWPHTDAGQQENAPTWVKFYAGLPLITSTGLFLGSICVMDIQPGRLSSSQQALLTEVADRIIALV